MAVTKSITKKKVQISLDNSENGSGQQAKKTVSVSRLKLNATDEQFFNLGMAIGNLCSLPVSDINLIETSSLAEG
jgi:hypothetical protein